MVLEIVNNDSDDSFCINISYVTLTLGVAYADEPERGSDRFLLRAIVSLISDTDFIFRTRLKNFIELDPLTSFLSTAEEQSCIRNLTWKPILYYKYMPIKRYQ